MFWGKCVRQEISAASDEVNRKIQAMISSLSFSCQVNKLQINEVSRRVEPSQSPFKHLRTLYDNDFLKPFLVR